MTESRRPKRCFPLFANLDVMDRWTEIEVFVQIAELGSISRAAEALGLSNAAASRHLSALEHRLAARLIQRNTRRLYLTDAGSEFFNQCRKIISDLYGAESAVNATVVNPTGLLRITGSLSFCMNHVVPLLPDFTACYPGLRVEIVAANRYYDLIENGIDLAIRTREYEGDSNIAVRRLAITRRILAASPQYLQRNGTPENLEQLARHPLLIYTYANQPDKLRFKRDDKNRRHRCQGRARSQRRTVATSGCVKSHGNSCTTSLHRP